MYNISLASWYCMDFDNFIWGGKWEGDFVALFQVNAEQCINSTNNNYTCATQENISNAFKNLITSGNLYFSDLSLYVQPTLNNNESPLTTVIINNYQFLSIDITKLKTQLYKVTSINDDIGWFFEDIRKSDFINTESIIMDFLL